MRATLYDSISQLRRARLHGRVGEALVALRGGDLDPHLAMLAHHFAQAAPVERPDRAIDFALAAARRADRLLAWEEAAQHYRAALRARELAGAVDDHVRAELLLALGTSEDRAGMEEEARETFQAAIRTARQLGDAVLLARGALGVAGPWSALSRSDPGRVSLLDEAMEALPEEDSPLRARLLARLALELYYAGEPELRLSLSRGGGEIARRIGDPRTLATCLDARHYALWLPENVEERLEVAAELRRVAEETGDPELELQGAGWTIIDLMELGDIEGVDIQIAAASKLAEALHRPIWLWWTSLFRGARAQLAGELRRGRAADPGDARDRPARPGRERPALLRAGDVQHPPRAGPAGRGRGRRARVHRALPGDPGLARGAGADAGRARAARTRRARSSRRSPRGGFAAFPRDANWLIAITLMAEVCGALGDADRAAELYAAARALRGPQRGRGPQRDLQRLGVAAARASSPRPGARTTWPRATSTRPRRCTPRWAPGRGTPARRCPTRRCCSRGGTGDDAARASGDARRRDPGGRRAGDGRAGRAGAAAGAGARRHRGGGGGPGPAFG